VADGARDAPGDALSEPRAARFVRASGVKALAPALVVGLVYVVWAVAVAFDGSPARLALIGERFLDQGAGTSASIDALREDAVDRWGYDGQFMLYMALEPIDAREYVDNAAYRYGRPMYPLTASVLALRTPGAVPAALVVLNIVAAFALTWALAWSLVRFEVSGWYALIAGLYPGLAIAVGRDLVEPLAYAFAAVGALVLVWSRHRWKIVAAGLVFALAALARETTLLFPLAAALALVLGEAPTEEQQRPWRGRATRALTLFGISAAPLLVLKVFLALDVRGDGFPSAIRPEPIPFGGLLVDGVRNAADVYQLKYLVLPAVIGLALVSFTVRRPSAPILALALNILVLVVLLPRRSYEDYLTSSRIMLGVPVAFVLCLPLLPRIHRLVFALAPAVIWLAAWGRIYDFFVSL
jgi:hypothetical protein